MAIDPKLLDIDIQGTTIKLSDEISKILEKIKTIKLYDDTDKNDTFGVFFETGTDRMFQIPSVIDDVEKCKTKVKNILSELNRDVEKVMQYIGDTIDDQEKQTENRKVISNFNEIKTIFSRLYVCILVYEQKKESATTDIKDKINKLKEFLRDTTEFLLNLDDISTMNDKTKWPSLQTDEKTNIDL